MREYVMAETLLTLTLPTDVAPAPETPLGFALEQNYPNPFNPVTSIRFSIPRESHVQIRIYSVLGTLVQTLLDAPLAAGSHSVRFDGSRLPSGVYLCRLQSDGRELVRKMLLQK